ncbi:MAG: hypothetical protein Q9227_008685 [Pyrenula ochraceoflavens]
MGWLSSKLDIRQTQRLQAALDRINELEAELDSTISSNEALQDHVEDLEASISQGLEDLNEAKRSHVTAYTALENSVAEQSASHEARSDQALALLENETAARFQHQREALLAEERAVRAERALTLRLRSEQALVENETHQGTILAKISQPFVVVLVDGDAYFFQDTYVQAGKNGGVSVAQDIRSEVSKYIGNHPRIPSHSSIVVRIFMNKSTACSRATERLGENMTRPFDDCLTNASQSMHLFDIIDCGVGKERVDQKIHANFNLHINNSHCHAILLAACHDNGYMRLLEQYIGNMILQQKIALITTTQVGSEFGDMLAPNGPFEGLNWPKIFNQRPVPSPMRLRGMRAIEYGSKQWALSQQRRENHTAARVPGSRASRRSNSATSVISNVSETVSQPPTNILTPPVTPENRSRSARGKKASTSISGE